jgi:hypothetical protein
MPELACSPIPDVLRLDFCGDIKIFDAAVHNVIPFIQRATAATKSPNAASTKRLSATSPRSPRQAAESDVPGFFPETRGWRICL